MAFFKFLFFIFFIIGQEFSWCQLLIDLELTKMLFIADYLSRKNSGTLTFIGIRYLGWADFADQQPIQH